MKHFIFSIIVLSLPFAAIAEKPSSDGKTGEFFIYPTPNGWQPASMADVQQVAISVGSTLMRYFPDKKLNPIILKNDNSSTPITLFKKGPQNEFIIKVNFKERFWSQLAYQFSHEFGHVLSNYANEGGENQWFEEAICEAISLITLEKMAISWQTKPPYPNWKSYAKPLQSYLDDRLTTKYAKLDTPKNLSAWYLENKKILESKPYGNLKSKETAYIVSKVIYDLFHEDNHFISSIQYLSLGKKDKEKSLITFLKEWEENSPDEYKARINKIIALFES